MTAISVDVAGVFHTFEPGQTVTFGRSPEATVVIDDKTVSRIHAQLKFVPERSEWVFEDLQSANGSYVNGTQITTHTLRLPVTLEIGSQDAPHALRFEEVAAPPIVNVEEATIPNTPEITVPIVVPEEAFTPPTIQTEVVLETVNCGYCTGPINRDFGPKCPACETYIHAECFTAFDGCVTYECSENPNMKVDRGSTNV